MIWTKAGKASVSGNVEICAPIIIGDIHCSKAVFATAQIPLMQLSLSLLRTVLIGVLETGNSVVILKSSSTQFSNPMVFPHFYENVAF